MKKIYLLLFSLCFVGQLLSQTYKQAIITAVHYSVQQSAEASMGEAFPFYFHHQEFTQDIFSDIEKFTKSSFKVDKVVFSEPMQVQTSSSFMRPSLNAKATAQAEKDPETVYIEVLTFLNLRHVTNGIPVYGFHTFVSAFNFKGKEIYHSKITIPFETLRGEEIADQVMMGEEDFYAFYLEGLEQAFASEDKKIEKRYVMKPTAGYYQDFVASSEKFYMTRIPKGYAYGRNIDETREVLTFKSSFWKNSETSYNFEGVVSGNWLKEGYRMMNHLNNEEYLVKLKGGETTIFNFLSATSPVEVEFRDMAKTEIGNLTFNWDDALTGSFQSKDYRVKYNPVYFCSEVYSGNQLIALLNYLPDFTVIFVHQTATEEQLADLFNLIFVWDFSINLRQQLEAGKEQQN